MQRAERQKYLRCIQDCAEFLQRMQQEINTDQSNHNWSRVFEQSVNLIGQRLLPVPGTLELYNTERNMATCNINRALSTLFRIMCCIVAEVH